jgi:hypothetical protein
VFLEDLGEFPVPTHRPNLPGFDRCPITISITHAKVTMPGSILPDSFSSHGPREAVEEFGDDIEFLSEA